MTFRRRVGAMLVLTCAACVTVWAAAPPSDAEFLKKAQALFKPLPKVMDSAANPITPVKVQLGKMLYYEPRLSKSNVISCNSCHNLATYGVDNLPASIGHRWAVGSVNAPTTLNAAAQVAQFWDGRAKDVEEQAKGPILNPAEMGLAHADIAVENIASIPHYVGLFQKAFPGEAKPVTYDNIAKAIGDFERTLTTPGRFDKFLEGDVAALEPNERKGLATFIEVGCASCHKGALFGGGAFEKFGVFRPYQEATGSKVLDTGRFEQTNKEDDKFVFKTAPLRNIERTYPYFHDGSVWDLDTAIAVMLGVQLDKKLAIADIENLRAFLYTLTGEVPIEARTLPVLPPSTKKTARPDVN
jgi:cytochrome c peroxidase